MTTDKDGWLHFKIDRSSTKKKTNVYTCDKENFIHMEYVDDKLVKTTRTPRKRVQGSEK